MKPAVSIIIPSRGRSDKLATLLGCLTRQQCTLSGAFEVIVALDGGDGVGDGLDAAVMPFPLHVLSLDQVGISAAKNAAVARARGDLLLFLNDDVEPAGDFVEQHVAAHRAGHAIVLGASPFKSVTNCTLFDACIARTRMIFFYGGMKAGMSYGFRHAWNLNLSVDREMLNAVAGPFAEALRPCMYEDLELAYRLMGSASRVFYCPAAVAVHNHRYTLAEYLARESMLGVMAHRLHQLNPACAVAVFGAPLEAMMAKARGGLEIDQADATDTFMALAELAARGFGSDCDAAMIDLYYRAHLPLKRRAFRRGLLAAANRPETPWQSRWDLAREALADDPVLGGARLRLHEVSRSVTLAGVGGGPGANLSRISSQPV